MVQRKTTTIVLMAFAGIVAVLVAGLFITLNTDSVQRRALHTDVRVNGVSWTYDRMEGYVPFNARPVGVVVRLRETVEDGGTRTTHWTRPPVSLRSDFVELHNIRTSSVLPLLWGGRTTLDMTRVTVGRMDTSDLRNAAGALDMQLITDVLDDMDLFPSAPPPSPGDPPKKKAHDEIVLPIGLRVTDRIEMSEAPGDGDELHFVFSDVEVSPGPLSEGVVRMVGTMDSPTVGNARVRAAIRSGDVLVEALAAIFGVGTLTASITGAAEQGGLIAEVHANASGSASRLSVYADFAPLDVDGVGIIDARRSAVWDADGRRRVTVGGNWSTGSGWALDLALDGGRARLTATCARLPNPLAGLIPRKATLDLTGGFELPMDLGWVGEALSVTRLSGARYAFRTAASAISGTYLNVKPQWTVEAVHPATSSNLRVTPTVVDASVYNGSGRVALDFADAPAAAPWMPLGVVRVPPYLDAGAATDPGSGLREWRVLAEAAAAGTRIQLVLGQESMLLRPSLLLTWRTSNGTRASLYTSGATTLPYDLSAINITLRAQPAGAQVAWLSGRGLGVDYRDLDVAVESEGVSVRADAVSADLPWGSAMFEGLAVVAGGMHVEGVQATVRPADAFAELRWNGSLVRAELAALRPPTLTLATVLSGLGVSSNTVFIADNLTALLAAATDAGRRAQTHLRASSTQN